jgi:precorrin-6B C5,15-methyltransferase / cobalt-precorrin-6B C5,C15-methyltransferase
MGQGAMTVTVIGIDGGPLGPRAMEALARASTVIGWPQQVALIEHLVPPRTQRLAIDRHSRAQLDALAAAEGDRVLLASGDPGYFGVVRAVTAEHADVRVVPAVSSVAAVFAAAALSWDDAQVVSAHGLPPHHALAVCRRFPKVAVLTEPGFGPAELGAGLAHLGKRFVVAERLGLRDERITRVSAADALDREWADPNVVIVTDPRPAPVDKGWSAPRRWTADRWALPAAGFDHRNGTGLSAEVRAVVLAWLGPGLGALVWDVGAGSGLVAVEAARLGAAVIAIEQDAEQRARIAANARRHDVPIEVVDGRAPSALGDLPTPDTVFVGGGGHLLTEIVRTAAERARRAVVVVLHAAERVGPTHTALADAGLEVEGARLSAAAISRTTDVHRPTVTDPVFVLRGGRA